MLAQTVDSRMDVPHSQHTSDISEGSLKPAGISIIQEKQVQWNRYCRPISQRSKRLHDNHRDTKKPPKLLQHRDISLLLK